jgi:hypothetical protein
MECDGLHEVAGMNPSQLGSDGSIQPTLKICSSVSNKILVMRKKSTILIS